MVREFVFSDDQLVYRLHSQYGIIDERVISWQLIPSPHHFRQIVALPERALRALTYLSLTAFVLLFAQRGSTSAAYAILIFIAMFYASFGVYVIWRWKPHTAIPMDDWSIEIHAGGDHDEIVNAILDRRKRYFLRYADIKKDETIRQNLRRLRWLTEIEVLSPMEFLQSQAKLLPTSTSNFMRPSDTTPIAILQQRRNLTRVKIELYDSYFRYRRAGLSTGQITLNSDYFGLPEKISGAKLFNSQWMSLALFSVTMMAISAISLWLDPEGTHEFSWIEIPVAAIWSAVFMQQIVGFWGAEIFRGVMLLAGAEPDSNEIWREITRCKQISLLRRTWPDPLATEEEYKATLDELVAQGNITAEDSERFTATARLQGDVLLDSLPDAQSESSDAQTMH